MNQQSPRKRREQRPESTSPYSEFEPPKWVGPVVLVGLGVLFLLFALSIL